MEIRWRPDRLGFNPDLLQYQSELQAATDKHALCIIGNDISRHIFPYYLDRKGWTFHNDHPSTFSMAEAINAGAQYLYSDSRILEALPCVEPYLDKLILEAGTIRVYSLQKQ